MTHVTVLCPKSFGPTSVVVDTGDIIAAIFDAVAGTPLEPVAANLAWGFINGRRYRLEQLQRRSR